MKPSIKAALLSAFVIPGAGHFYLKKRLAGLTLCGISLGVILYLVFVLTGKALEIMAGFQAEGMPVDMQQLAALVTEQASRMDTGPLTLATLVFLACWVIGIVDAWRQGRAQD